MIRTTGEHRHQTRISDSTNVTSLKTHTPVERGDPVFPNLSKEALSVVEMEKAKLEKL